MHSQLTGVVSTLSDKVTDVMKQQEDEFLSAYRAHMYTVQKELQELRNKVRSAEVSLQRDETIKTLTQERDWFRKEALRLDTVSTSMKKELKYMEEKVQCIEEDRKWLEKQLKTSKKQGKLLKSELELQLEGKLFNNSQQKLDPVPSEGLQMITNSSSTVELGSQLHSGNVTIPRSHSSVAIYRAKEEPAAEDAALRKQIKQLKEQLKHERQATNEIRAEFVSSKTFKGELEQFFLSCIEEVKKDVAKRHAEAKRSSSKKSKNFTEEQEICPRDIKAVSFKKFALSDKRKVINQLLLQDQVYSHLYDALFEQQHVETSIYGFVKPDTMVSNQHSLPELLSALDANSH